MASNQLATKELVLLPALITLVVTLLRLSGELLGWSRALFSPEAGGGASLVGIVWLVPVFGVYFAWKLAASGPQAASAGKTIGYAFLALLITVLAALLTSFAFGPTSPPSLVILAIVSVGAAYLVRRGWPELFSTLLAYGLAARIPVVLVMFFAILGDWGTHYDVRPSPDFPEMNAFVKWVLIGLIPQLTIWIAFTVIVGAIVGGITLAIVGRRGVSRAA